MSTPPSSSAWKCGRRLTARVTIAIALFALITASCSSTASPPAETSEGGQAVQTQSPQPAEAPQSADGPLAPSEIFARISPSIPLIETLSGATGSGILIEDGYVVTNYHVVWPHDEVWVVFPDGTEFQDVPVLGYDFMADIAVLGPITHNAPSLVLTDGEGMPQGSELFLIGYPADSEVFPEPTITRGILSRIRQWDTFDLTLFQTDAAIAGGQSGGALVNDQGEVVGISTWRFSEAGFGIATSAADDAAIVDGIIQDHGTTEPASERRTATQTGEFALEVADVIARAFTFEGAAGTIATISINGEEDGFIRISDTTGLLQETDTTSTGLETASFEVLRDGTHLVIVDSWSFGYSFDLTSSVRLLPYEDPDDGWRIADGIDFELSYGLIDFHYDTDWSIIELDAGETIVAYTDSILGDTSITIWNPQTDEFVFDDDSGPISILNNPYNAQLEFTAPSTGEYVIFVGDEAGERGAGYALFVERLG